MDHIEAHHHLYEGPAADLRGRHMIHTFFLEILTSLQFCCSSHLQMSVENH